MTSGLSTIEGSFTTDRTAGDDQRTSVHRITGELRGPIAAVSFWSAIVLPALYVPLLFNGIEGIDGLGVFLGLFGLHVLALVGGQHHRGNHG